MPVTSYENGEMRFFCDICQLESSMKIPPTFIPVYIDEYKAYENFNFECKNCKEAGRNVMHIININLPEFEEMELEVIELLAPEEEIQARRAIRNFMWNVRPDLKNKNRATERAEYIRKNKGAIDRLKSEIEREKRERTNPVNDNN